ncbi:nucleotidyltransferase family protein [Natronospora cellulosivora (SeqCode)]
MVSKKEILNYYKYRGLNDIFNKLEKINYAIIKGEPLSILAYGEKGIRTYNDIDILVSKKNLLKVSGILREKAKVEENLTREEKILLYSLSHQIQPINIIYKNITINIDLNYDILWGEYKGQPIDIEEFLSDNIQMNIYGCCIKTLTPLKAFIQLCLHNYKDLNSVFILASRHKISLSSFKDIYNLLINNLDKISIDELYNKCKKYKILPYIYYILFYTNKIYKNNIIDKYVQSFKTSEGVSLLNSYGLNNKERKEWRISFQDRLKCENLYDIIKSDLTEKDISKIKINKKIFN